jgi:hypothetical protein
VRGLDHRAVHAQLAPARDLEPARQRHHPLVEGGQRRGFDQVGPAQQGGVVGHPLQIDATELPEHQAVADEALDLLIAPAVQAPDHEQAQDDLDRRVPGRPRVRLCGARRAARQVGLDPAEDLIVIEQAIELAQHRLEVGHELRHQREQ